MSEEKPRVAFQGEHGAFSEAAALQLLGENIETVPRATFDALFRAIEEGAADALLAPVENSLAGSVVRVYDLLLESELGIVAETILRIEHHLIGCPGATLEGLKSVASHPVALAQCEKFFLEHPRLRRVTVEDTAGSVRDAVAAGDKTAAGIAGRRAALRYGGEILAEGIQDNPENYTRFVLLVPVEESLHSHHVGTLKAMSPALTELMTDLGVHRECHDESPAIKLSLAMRLAHQPGALLAALEPFSKYGINLLKIESRPIHGRPWEYQFFLDVQTDKVEPLQQALEAVQKATSFLRVLGMYPPAQASVVSGK
jgi:prephenate dehydratase